MDYLSFVLCLVLAWIAIHLILSTTKNDRLPPGPTPLPVFGNLFVLGSKPHVSLAQLAKTYGPLMRLRLGRVLTVVISSPVLAKQLLQKHDSLFANRTVSDAVRALNHHEKSLAFMPASTQWRKFRKICNSHVFSTAKLEATQNLRRNKVNDLVSHVKKCSQVGATVDIGQAAFTTTLNLLANTFFSVDLGDPTSQVARELKGITRGIMEELGEVNFSDYFPILRKIDPQGIRRRTSVHFARMIQLFNTIIHERLLQRDKQLGSVQGNDVLDALLGINQEKAAEIHQSDIAELLLDLFVAGTDTTSSTLEWAMTELIHNPEKLKKAQAEVEQVLGKGNPVEEPDITRLPYLRAIIKETFRLHPSVPFLVPRKAESDVEICGCIIPKNAQVLVNVWAIGKDPNIWENPTSFEPERFLGSDIDVKGQDFELIPFGAGRRICPGLPLATRMLPLMLSSLIHGFDWKLEDGIIPEKMNMDEKFGFTLAKAQPLHAIPICI